MTQSGRHMELDYQETVQHFRMLADIRFRLLAVVPVVTGAAVGVLTKEGVHVAALPVGLLGFLVTLGIVFYDQRNTQIYDSMITRAKSLEAHLAMVSVKHPRWDPSEYKEQHDGWFRGGPFNDRPPRTLYLFGWAYLRMWHDRGLAIIYSGSLAAWSYLIAAGGLLFCGATERVAIGVALLFGIIVGVVFFLGLNRFDREGETRAAIDPDIEKLLRTPVE